MKTNIIKIGNSKGIRIPSNILKECNFDDEVEIKVVENKILIQAVKEPRKGWGTSFKEMHKNKDDELIIDDSIDIQEDWDW